MKTYIIQRQQQHQRSCARTFAIERKQNQKCSDNFYMYIQQYNKRAWAWIATADSSPCDITFAIDQTEFKCLPGKIHRSRHSIQNFQKRLCVHITKTALLFCITTISIRIRKEIAAVITVAAAAAAAPAYSMTSRAAAAAAVAHIHTHTHTQTHTHTRR